jgi:hypothetical protein
MILAMVEDGPLQDKLERLYANCILFFAMLILI